MSSIANIFILTNTLKLGGAEKQSIYLANALKNNLKDCPYTLNGDFYLIKKRAIEKEMAEDKKVEEY